MPEKSQPVVKPQTHRTQPQTTLDQLNIDDANFGSFTNLSRATLPQVTPQNILRLQATVGNQTVQRWLAQNRHNLSATSRPKSTSNSQAQICRTESEEEDSSTRVSSSTETESDSENENDNENENEETTTSKTASDSEEDSSTRVSSSTENENENGESTTSKTASDSEEDSSTRVSSSTETESDNEESATEEKKKKRQTFSDLTDSQKKFWNDTALKQIEKNNQAFDKQDEQLLKQRHDKRVAKMQKKIYKNNPLGKQIYPQMAQSAETEMTRVKKLLQKLGLAADSLDVKAEKITDKGGQVKNTTQTFDSGYNAVALPNDMASATSGTIENVLVIPSLFSNIKTLVTSLKGMWKAEDKAEKMEAGSELADSLGGLVDNALTISSSVLANIEKANLAQQFTLQGARVVPVLGVIASALQVILLVKEITEKSVKHKKLLKTEEPTSLFPRRLAQQLTTLSEKLTMELTALSSGALSLTGILAPITEAVKVTALAGGLTVTTTSTVIDQVTEHKQAQALKDYEKNKSNSSNATDGEAFNLLRNDPRHFAQTMLDRARKNKDDERATNFMAAFGFEDKHLEKTSDAEIVQAVLDEAGFKLKPKTATHKLSSFKKKFLSNTQLDAKAKIASKLAQVRNVLEAGKKQRGAAWIAKMSLGYSTKKLQELLNIYMQGLDDQINFCAKEIETYQDAKGGFHAEWRAKAEARMAELKQLRYELAMPQPQQLLNQDDEYSSEDE